MRALTTTFSRRQLLNTVGAGVIGGLLATTKLFAADIHTKKLGLLIPAAGGTLPGEAKTMYHNEIDYLIETLGVARLTPDGYEAVIDKIAPQAKKLAQRGAEAIVLMGTSLSFFKGENFNQRLTLTLQKATGLPSITMSTAVIEGLKTVGARTVVAATAYNDEVNERLRLFLGEHGLNAVTVKGLGIEDIEELRNVTPEQLIEFGTDVFNSSPGADAILVACGGLPTLEILRPLEQRINAPAVSSTPHALRAGAKLLGLDNRMPGYGKLLETL